MRIIKKIEHYNQRFAIVQRPNAPLIIWFVGAVGARLIKHGFIHTAMTIISLAALIIWALLEILRGTSIFRRILGALILLLVLYSRLSN